MSHHPGCCWRRDLPHILIVCLWQTIRHINYKWLIDNIYIYIDILFIAQIIADHQATRRSHFMAIHGLSFTLIPQRLIAGKHVATWNVFVMSSSGHLGIHLIACYTPVVCAHGPPKTLLAYVRGWDFNSFSCPGLKDTTWRTHENKNSWNKQPVFHAAFFMSTLQMHVHRY